MLRQKKNYFPTFFFFQIFGKVLEKHVFRMFGENQIFGLCLQNWFFELVKSCKIMKKKKS